jgi:hypothetical protein
MNILIRALIHCCVVCVFAIQVSGAAAVGMKKLIIIAGKPSHGPREHEYRAGALLLQKCLAGTPGLLVEVDDLGWVKNEKDFDDADAVVFFSDGGSNHPALQGDHLAKLGALMEKGVGLGCIHYAAEFPAETVGRNLSNGSGATMRIYFRVTQLGSRILTIFQTIPSVAVSNLSKSRMNGILTCASRMTLRRPRKRAGRGQSIGPSW